MHLQPLADARVEDYRRLNVVYLERYFVSHGPKKTCRIDGLGTVDIGSKQLGLHQKSRPLDRTQQVGVR